MDETVKAMALARGRLGLDKRGRDGRAPVLANAITAGERLQLSIETGRRVQDSTGGGRTVDWRSNLRTLYAVDTLDVGLNTGSDNWTSRVWRNHIDSGVRFNSYTYANAAARLGATGFSGGDVGKLALQSDTFEFYKLTATTPAWEKLDATRPFVPLGTNPYGGYDWARSLLFDAGYGPVKATFPGAGVAHYSQQTTTLLELLDAAGNAIKSATVITTWTFDFDPTAVPELTMESKAHGDFTFDGNGAAIEFWGVRVTLTLRDSPTWIDALNNTYFFRLDWITGNVE